MAPSWCLDTWEGQDTSSSPTASGTVPRARSSEIPSLSLRTLYLLHAAPVPTQRWPKFPVISSITGRVGHVLYSYNYGSDVNRLLKKKKDGLKYDKVIRLTSVNNPAFIPPKWDCLLNFFHRYFQHSHGSKTENTQRYN